MANVAQNVARAQDGPQLTEAMQQKNVIQQNKELSEKVQRAADESSKSSAVKEDGRNSSGKMASDKNKKRKQETDEAQEEDKKDDGIRESYLGQHINLTR